MLPQRASAFSVIQFVAQQRAARAAQSRRAGAGMCQGIGPAHIRAALMFACTPVR